MHYLLNTGLFFYSRKADPMKEITTVRYCNIVYSAFKRLNYFEVHKYSIVLHLVLNNEIVILPAFSFCANGCLASIEDLGDKCNVVFSGILWEAARGGGEPLHDKCFKIILIKFSRVVNVPHNVHL
jgi:hypothetical protein